jgi:hypothetical protein
MAQEGMVPDFEDAVERLRKSREQFAESALDFLGF